MPCDVHSTVVLLYNNSGGSGGGNVVASRAHGFQQCFYYTSSIKVIKKGGWVGFNLFT